MPRYKVVYKNGQFRYFMANSAEAARGKARQHAIGHSRSDEKIVSVKGDVAGGRCELCGVTFAKSRDKHEQGWLHKRATLWQQGRTESNK